MSQQYTAYLILRATTRGRLAHPSPRRASRRSVASVIRAMRRRTQAPTASG